VSFLTHSTSGMVGPQIGFRQNVSVAQHINHALCFKVGGLITVRHNEFRDVTAELLSTICKDVRKEPALDETTCVRT